MLKPLKKTIICLRISAVIYLILGFAIFFVLQVSPLELFPELPLNVGKVFLYGLVFGTSLFCFLLVFGLEWLVRGLKKGRYWAWVIGLITCGIYLPSLFFLLGLIGLIGLLDKEVATEFEKSKKQETQNPVSK